MGRRKKSDQSGDTTEFTVNPALAEQDDDAKSEIVPANLRALEAVHFAAMLDEARIFEVVDELVHMFGRGDLALGPGRAGAVLYRFWKSGNRLTTGQRQSVYSRAFGIPIADKANSNRNFQELWVKFVSIVGMYSAELQTLPPSERTVSTEDVLISGRDLALNLSNYGHGLAWFAGTDFKLETQQVLELLSNRDLQEAFGAEDAWHVIYTVAASAFGARPNVKRAFTRAESGLIIIRWLSNRRTRLLRPRSANILRDEDICEGRTAASQNKKPTVYPTDADLVVACEQWLGVTGTQEAELNGEWPQDNTPLPATVSEDEEALEPEDVVGGASVP